jgi:predicted metal-dependent hydrolase
MGLVPTGVRITDARKRFGSCSSKNRLCFSWRLMQYPPEAIDYVVVHELAHIRHHDHSPSFWGLVEQTMPDFRRREALLRD